MLDLNNIDPGDILLFSGDHLLSRGIQEFTDSPWNHAAIAIGNGLLVEATAAGIEINPINRLLRANTRMCVRRIRGLEFRKSRDICEYAENAVGYGYDYWQIITMGIYFALRRLFGRAPLWLIGDIPGRMICSYFVADCVRLAGIRFRLAKKLITPATLYRSIHFKTVFEYDTKKETITWQLLHAPLTTLFH